MRSSRGAAAAVLFAGALAGAAAATPEPPGEPRQIIEKTVVEVLAILQQKDSSTEERRHAIEAIAHERFDFATMSRLVLGKSWRRLSKEQRAEFVGEFTEYLANDYGNRIERYEQEQVDVIGERAEPRGDVTVKTRIVGGANDGALVDYRMRNRKAGWKIIDVVIEGISLVANFRDQFREVMANGGPENLLQKLREKNAASASQAG